MARAKAIYITNHSAKAAFSLQPYLLAKAAINHYKHPKSDKLSDDRLASDCAALPDEPLKLSDGLLNSIRQMHERWNNRLEFESLDIAKAYIEGRIGVLVNFKRLKFANGHLNRQRRNHDGQEHMLIFHVQTMKTPNEISYATFEKFEVFEEIRQVTGRCFYSATHSFVTKPIICDRELGVSVLCAAVDSSQFPVRLIESRSQIMNHIGSDKGEIGGRILAEVNIDSLLPAFQVFGNGKSVRVSLAEGSQEVFKICDVMLGPFDL